MPNHIPDHWTMKKFPAIPGTIDFLNCRYDMPLSFCIHLRCSASLCARLIVIIFSLNHAAILTLWISARLLTHLFRWIRQLFIRWRRPSACIAPVFVSHDVRDWSPVEWQHIVDVKPLDLFVRPCVDDRVYCQHHRLNGWVLLALKLIFHLSFSLLSWIMAMIVNATIVATITPKNSISIWILRFGRP